MVNTHEIEQKFKKHFSYSGVITHVDPVTGQIDVDGYVGLQHKMTRLPVQFGNVTHTFSCSDSKLKTLVGAPSHVRGAFDCANNQLTTLQHAPEYVGRDFLCAHNKLTNLIGAPDQVGVDFNCHSNPLTSLEGAPKIIPGWFHVSYTPTLPLLRTLVARQGVVLHDAPREVKQILNDPAHMGKGKASAIKAAAELVRSGFKGNARW